jgi:hypothetical protein
MAKIAIDLDSTIYDFETPAREAFTQLAEKHNDPGYLRGAYCAWTEWRSPADAHGLDAWMEAIALCHDADVISQQRPFDGAVETCDALWREGHKLLYISNRATESLDATSTWLSDWGFLHDDDKVVCMMEDKRPYIEDCQYIIDDRPKTVVDFIYDYEWRHRMETVWDDHGENMKWEDFWDRNCRRAFVKAYPYNQNLTDIPHLYLAPTWLGISAYLVSKGVLSERPVNSVFTHLV